MRRKIINILGDLVMDMIEELDFQEIVEEIEEKEVNGKVLGRLDVIEPREE